MNRRSFLALGGASVATAIAGNVWWRSFDEPPAVEVRLDDAQAFEARTMRWRSLGVDPDAAMLLGLLPDPSAAGSLGLRISETVTLGLDEATVRSRLFGKLLSDGSTVSHEALRGRLRRSAAQDFDRGDALVIDGWLLARTEAELYVLAAQVGARRGWPNEQP